MVSELIDELSLDEATNASPVVLDIGTATSNSFRSATESPVCGFSARMSEIARASGFIGMHPETGKRALLLGHFIQKIKGLSSSDSAQLFAIPQGHVTRLENTVRWRWTQNDVAIWDNRATQHILVDDYGDRQRVLRRVTVEGDVPVSIDGKRSVIRNKDSFHQANGAIAQHDLR